MSAVLVPVSQTRQVPRGTSACSGKATAGAGPAMGEAQANSASDESRTMAKAAKRDRERDNCMVVKDAERELK